MASTKVYLEEHSPLLSNLRATLNSTPNRLHAYYLLLYTRYLLVPDAGVAYEARFRSKFRLRARPRRPGKGAQITHRGERKREANLGNFCMLDRSHRRNSYASFARLSRACRRVNSELQLGGEGERKGEKREHATKRNFAPTILGSREGRGGRRRSMVKPGFIRTSRVFSKLIFPGSSTVAPRVLSLSLGAKLVLCHGPAEFPERVVNRIMKTSEPACVGTPQSFVPTF